MASRTPHTGVAGEVLTAANLAKYPKGEIGVETGTATNIGTSDVDVAVVTVTVGADRLLHIHGTASITGAAGSIGAIFFIEEGTTDLGRVHRHPDGVDESFAAGHARVNAPSAGSHTYKLVGRTNSGDFDIFGNGRIEVVDMGPAYS